MAKKKAATKKKTVTKKRTKKATNPMMQFPKELRDLVAEYMKRDQIFGQMLDKFGAAQTQKAIHAAIAVSKKKGR